MKLSHLNLKKGKPTSYASNGCLDPNIPLNEWGDAPIKIYKDTPKSKMQKVKNFIVSHPEIVPVATYCAAATVGYASALANPYYRDLLLHGQTTSSSIIPFYQPHSHGDWGLPRRALSIFENPLVAYTIYPAGIYAVSNVIKRVIKHVKKDSKQSK